LDGEPIAARRVGRVGRAWKWCRRKPAAAALLVVTVAALAALLVGLTTFSVLQGRMATEERRLRKDAELDRAAAHKANTLAQSRLDAMSHLLYLAHVRAARQAWESADLARAEQLLKRWEPRKAKDTDLRGWEWYYLRQLCRGRFALPGHPARAVAI